MKEREARTSKPILTPLSLSEIKLGMIMYKAYYRNSKSFMYIIYDNIERKTLKKIF
jgi:hypothetical protein